MKALLSKSGDVRVKTGARLQDLLFENGLQTLFIIGIVAATVIGIWLRLRYLGSLGLVEDEGHQALAVQGVLSHGYPLVPSGRLYTRSLPLIYIQSASSLIFGLSEFALRLPSVLFNLGTVIVTYLLGRKLFGSGIGVAAAAVLMLSVWEIEMSRNARMYAALQFWFTLGILFFYEGFVLDKRPYKSLTIGTFLLTYTFHPIGLSLVTLFAIPFFLEKPKRNSWKILLVSSATFFLLCLLYSFAVRWFTLSLNETPLLSSTGETALAVGPYLKKIILKHLYTPPIGMLKHLYTNHTWLFLSLAGAVLGVSAYLVKGISGKLNKAFLYIVLLLSVLFAFSHQILLSVVALYIITLLYRREILPAGDRRLFVAGVAVLMLSFFWHAYGALCGSQNFSFIWMLWNYPLFYPYFATWLLRGFPLLLLLLAVSFAYFTVQALRNDCDDTVVYGHLVIVFPLLFASIPKFYFYSSRYVFHAYPIIIIICCLAVYLLIERLWNKSGPGSLAVTGSGSERRRLVGYGLTALTIMIASQDVSLTEAREIGEMARGHEYQRSIVKSTGNLYPYSAYHQDYKSPSFFLRKNAGPDDLIIILCKAHMPSIYRYYSGLNVSLVMEEIQHYGIKTKRGLVHYMTGDVILKNAEDLKEALGTNQNRNVWLVADPYLLNNFKNNDLLSVLNQQEWIPKFIGSDMKTTVFLKRHP